jgi:hypothetical protein
MLNYSLTIRFIQHIWALTTQHSHKWTWQLSEMGFAIKVSSCWLQLNTAGTNLPANNNVPHHQKSVVSVTFIVALVSNSYPNTLLWHTKEKVGRALCAYWSATRVAATRNPRPGVQTQRCQSDESLRQVKRALLERYKRVKQSVLPVNSSLSSLQVWCPIS